MKRIYIETTNPSFYHEVRIQPDMVARRDWTREWWDNYRAGFELVTSEAVIDELEKGAFPKKAEALDLIETGATADSTEPSKTRGFSRFPEKRGAGNTAFFGSCRRFSCTLLKPYRCSISTKPLRTSLMPISSIR